MGVGVIVKYTCDVKVTKSGDIIALIFSTLRDFAVIDWDTDKANKQVLVYYFAFRWCDRISCIDNLNFKWVCPYKIIYLRFVWYN